MEWVLAIRGEPNCFGIEVRIRMTRGSEIWDDFRGIDGKVEVDEEVEVNLWSSDATWKLLRNVLLLLSLHEVVIDRTSFKPLSPVSFPPPSEYIKSFNLSTTPLVPIKPQSTWPTQLSLLTLPFFKCWLAQPVSSQLEASLNNESKQPFSEFTAARQKP